MKCFLPWSTYDNHDSMTLKPFKSVPSETSANRRVSDTGKLTVFLRFRRENKPRYIIS